MRNRALHEALRNFALEAAALLTDELKAGAEVEFDVVDEGRGRGPALYRYEPRTGAFIEERWPQLRELPACEPACRELGAGASAWLRVNGLRGEQAEPALRAMLERLYEDATSFGFPEERFDRVYGEVELTLYRDAVRARVIAPLHGAWMDAERVELGDGLSLMRGDALEGPHERSCLLCVLERDVPADDPIPADEAAERFAEVVTAMRLWAPGGVVLGAPGWRQADHARWQPVAIGAAASARGAEWMLGAGDEQAFREFFTAITSAQPSASVAWALDRFEMGCAQQTDAEALTDNLLGLRALLDATTTEAGQASFGLRLAALCAEEGARRELQDRMEAAIALERFVMGNSGGVRLDAESPRELVGRGGGPPARAAPRRALRLPGRRPEDGRRRDPDRVAGRAARRDRGARPARRGAGLGAGAEPEPASHTPRFERDEEPVTFEPDLEWEEEEYDTAEMEPVAVAQEPTQDEQAYEEPVQYELDGVTQSADWGWDEPEDFSAPV